MRLACSCSKKTRTSARIFPWGASMNCVSSLATISASEKWPSQSSRMMRPVPSTRIAPSGNSTTGDSAVPPQRHPAANFGTLVSKSSATIALRMPGGGVDSKSARRRPAGLDIGEVQRVQLGPQNVTLVADCLDNALLLAARSGVVEGVLDGKGGVFRRLRQAGLEIVEPGNQPGVVLTQFLQAQRDQVAGKKFGQRRSDAVNKG